MRVLYINHNAANGGLYGGNKVILNLISVLNEEIEIAMVFPSDGLFVQKCNQIGIKAYVIPRYHLKLFPSKKTIEDKIYYPKHLLGMILRRQFAIRKLTKIAEEFNPDIIHSIVGPLDIGYVVAKKKGIPHVWHLQEYQDKDFNMRPFPSMKNYRKHLHESNNHVVCITKDIFKHFELDQQKDKVIYNGIFDERKNNYKKEKKPYFLFVGSLGKAKGVIPLLNAFAEYIRKGGSCDLKFAAGWVEPYGTKLKNIIQKEGIGDKVQFLGYRDDVYELMSEAMALIVPSLCEGFGLITAEAMYNNCLVIGRNSGGTKEQFDNGKTLTGKEIALRFENDDQLAQLLFEVEQNGQQYYLEMIGRAFKTVNSLYTKRVFANNMLEYYKQILSK